MNNCIKLIKFAEYIQQNINESVTANDVVTQELSKIKNKLESYFSYKRKSNTNGLLNVQEFDNREKEKKGDVVLSDLGLDLVDSTLSKYSVNEDTYKIKFQDDEYLYMITFGIKLVDAIKKDNSDGIETEVPTHTNVTFKKYDLDGNLITTLSKRIEINTIDSDFIIGLKLETDENEVESLEVEYDETEEDLDDESDDVQSSNDDVQSGSQEDIEI